MTTDKRAFTLVELIVAIVLVGVLASLVGSTISGIKARAICAEAVTAMGVIRSAVRTYHVEYGRYPECWDHTTNVASTVPDSHGISCSSALTSVGLDIDSLNGIYFDKWSYYLDMADQVVPSDNQYNAILAFPWGFSIAAQAPIAPKSAETLKLLTEGADSGQTYLIMYIDKGKIKQSYMSRSGYPPDTDLIP